MTLAKSLHLSVLLFFIYKMGINMAPDSRVDGKTLNHADKALAQYPHVVRAQWRQLFGYY